MHVCSGSNISTKTSERNIWFDSNSYGKVKGSLTSPLIAFNITPWFRKSEPRYLIHAQLSEIHFKRGENLQLSTGVVCTFTITDQSTFVAMLSWCRFILPTYSYRCWLMFFSMLCFKHREAPCQFLTRPKLDVLVGGLSLNAARSLRHLRRAQCW